jgi:hypothetical protein
MRNLFAANSSHLPAQHNAASTMPESSGPLFADRAHPVPRYAPIPPVTIYRPTAHLRRRRRPAARSPLWYISAAASHGFEPPLPPVGPRFVKCKIFSDQLAADPPSSTRSLFPHHPPDARLLKKVCESRSAKFAVPAWPAICASGPIHPPTQRLLRPAQPLPPPHPPTLCKPPHTRPIPFLPI